jgi:hypothetical protein
MQLKQQSFIAVHKLNKQLIAFVVQWTLSPFFPEALNTNRVYSTAECVFIPVHYPASKSFAVAREAFRNIFLDREMPSNTSILM